MSNYSVEKIENPSVKGIVRANSLKEAKDKACVLGMKVVSNLKLV